MGRTNPTYRDYLQRFEERCRPMRRGLRREYEDDFDRLFDRARAHADAAGYLNSTDPELAIVLSVLLAHERELRRLREQVED
jgi:hypothetical protein